ncbi:SDR family NAD(P)-dependent oxidoreductase [Ovoidimarina sediminis]|uniref:SDR family NAD(P)-dependent oxidoreductase n=1 Tax=Ovoidimarina sediminis TaxID=3079856 RepID=UPI002908033D|nr:SDR family oxidoreductase [Rhodophyticola sp. MJ-SS7]MDU8943882.1 SDR family oxidoreductase [Rhodophyticola sp. MJ-SS7]
MTDQTKTAVVTGAARGIGLATTKLFLDRGWRVVMVDRDAPALLEAARDLDGTLPLIIDISTRAGAEEVARETATWAEGVDAVINNAGVAEFGPIETHDDDMWRRVMATNLDGPYFVTSALLPALKVRRGAIVNIASISGLRASTLRLAYGTSKAAVIQMTKQQAVEYGEYGIRANCVAPGPVRTKLAMAVHTQEIIDAYHDAIPLNRYGAEGEIASVIVFLCSEEASYVTGQVIAADGGFEATGVGLPALRGG